MMGRPYFKRINLHGRTGGVKKLRSMRQTHVHEFLGSTKLAEEGGDRHNHRFAGVTGQVIPRGNSHIHVITTNTDFFNHLHRVRIFTGPAISVGNGKHIHYVMGSTTLNDGHVHRFKFATLIQQPLI